MKTSTTIKVLLAIFLGVFLWLVIVSIQTQNRSPITPVTQELRDELVGRSENVVVSAGNLSIKAAVQEVYRSGEVHYQNVTFTNEKDGRTVNISGASAQTKMNGAEIAFVVMEKDVKVESSDGLTLLTDTLNYEGANKRIFSNNPANFTVNNLSGRCRSFVFFTETDLLELNGNVSCVMRVEKERESTENGATKTEPVRFYCDRLLYDQQKHEVSLIGAARIAQAGSYVRANRIDSTLTDDNKQFETVVVRKAVSHEESENDSETVKVADDPQDGGGNASLSYHASGIKDLRAETLTLEFTTGEQNLLSRVQAEGKARLDISPTSTQMAEGKTEMKRINADSIAAEIGDNGKGIKTLFVSNRTGKAKIEIKPLDRRRSRKSDEKNQQSPKPRVMTASEFIVNVEQESNEFKEIFMNGGMEMSQADLKLTCENGRYDAAKDAMHLSGNPVFQDSVKRVTGRTMVATPGIGDLTAEGDVESIFYPQPNSNSEAPGVFAFGSELTETFISSGSLQFDYKRNVLRFADGVRVNQGKTSIICQKLEIYLKDLRLIALGKTVADLRFSDESPPADSDQKSENDDISAVDNQANVKGRKKRGETESMENDKARISLSGERLEINKSKGEVRVVKNAQAHQSELAISAQEIRYEVDKDDKLLSTTASKDVRVDVKNVVIFGDNAEYRIKENLLLVEGKNVKYSEEGKIQAEYSRLEMNVADGTLKFFARAGQLVKTSILK